MAVPELVALPAHLLPAAVVLPVQAEAAEEVPEVVALAGDITVVL